MTKPKSAMAAADGSASAAKKKSTPKARKRKASDASVGSKTGASPAMKATTGDGGAGGVLSSGSGARGGSSAAAGVSDAHASVTPAVKPFVRGELVDSIKHMMFGFGDDAAPLDETAELMEDLVAEYIHAMTKKAMEMAAIKGKLDTECFIFLIRKDPERYERIAELLRANDEFRSVLNSGFDPSDEKMY